MVPKIQKRTGDSYSTFESASSCNLSVIAALVRLLCSQK